MRVQEERRSEKEGKNQGARQATAGRRTWRQAVGQATADSHQLCLSWLALLLQHSDARRAVWLSPSREASSPLFVLLVPFFMELT